MKRFTFVVSLAFVVAAGVSAAREDFNFVILGDRTGDHVPGVYGELVDEVNLLGPDLVVTVGDQIEGYSEDVPTLEAQWDEYWEIAGKLEAPFYVCPGNHDIYNDVMLEVWEERTKRDPCYSFDYEGVHFVTLDTGRWGTSEEWLEESGYREWLEKDLAKHKKDRLTVVLHHIPYWYETLADGEPDPLHDIFKEYGVDAVFNGHYHLYAAAEYDGIPYTIVGSSGGGIEEEAEYPGAFFQYVWCTVRGDELEWTVLKKGSAAPADTVLVADLKTIDKFETEYLRVPSFLFAEGDKEATFTILIENGTADAIATPVTWEVPDNWTLEPVSREVTLAPGDSAELEFVATLAGELYPLPEVTVAYPYRGELVHEFKTGLPACRTQPVKAVTSGPTVDGELGDACWLEAATAAYFCAPDGTVCTIDPTTFYFGYDDENLYVAARCEQEDMEALVVNAAERDAMVPSDDCVGFFFLPDPAENVFYQLYVNADGVIYDIAYTFEEPMELDTEGVEAWNADCEVATARGSGYWTFEAAIPVATLGADGVVAGDEWRANFRRKEQAKGSSADWQYPIGFDPRRFGYMAFE
ncbi:MAG TPA: metallophosphoesterase [bacterium]|nr:metallophosphoesterase [bacterium]